MQYAKRVVHSSVGDITLLASGKGLHTLVFSDRFDRVQQQLRQNDPELLIDHSENPFLDQTEEWLHYYFLKKPSHCRMPPLDLHGSPFHQTAWRALTNIPFGKTLSYGQLAKAIKSPKASRAIGGAMNKNPISLLLPCHRIIGVNGKLTGYGGGLDRKEWLLTHEGILG